MRVRVLAVGCWLCCGGVVVKYLHTPESIEPHPLLLINAHFFSGLTACGPVDGNKGGSYLTMLSSGGAMFAVVNLVGNFGTVR